MKLTKKINGIINYLFLALVILVPFFFLPWTSTLLGMDNFNKQNLLFLIIPILAFLLIFLNFKEGKLRFKCSILDYPILVFLGVGLAASILSIDKFSSIFGAYSYIEQSFILLFCLVLLYFFVIHFFNSESEVSDFLKVYFKIYVVLVFGSSVVVIAYWLNFLSNETFSLWFKLGVGTLDDVTVLIAVLNVLLLGLMYDTSYAKKIVRDKVWGKFLSTAIILSFILLILINFNVAWWTLLIGSLFIVWANYFKAGEQKSFWKKVVKFFRDKKYLWLNIAILIPLTILIFNFATYSEAVNLKRSAKKMQMNYPATLELSRQTLKSRPLFGYGPESYNYAFSFLRSRVDNNNDYWYLRYNHGASYLFDLIITTGFIGFVAYLVLILFLIKIIMAVLSKKRRKKGAKPGSVVFALIAVILSLLFTQVFYASNIVLLFLFWLFVGLFMVAIQDYFRANNKISFHKKVLKTEIEQRIFLIILFFIFFLWLVGFSFSTKYWLADYTFKNCLNQCSAEGQEQGLRKAIEYNPRRFNYNIALAKFYKERALNRMEKSNRNIEMIKSDIGNSINEAKKAVAKAPNSVVAYETLGSIYRDLSNYIQGDDLLTTEAFKQALNLEPSNPVLASELGNAYLKNKIYDEAAQAFQYSLNLRANNYEAAFGLGKTLLALKQSQEAMKIFNKIEEINPTADVYYEQGKIYYNLGNYEHAIIKFQQAISVAPLHANALYSLGLSLEKTEEYESALHYFNKVLKLNPDNEELKKKIEEIEAK